MCRHEHSSNPGGCERFNEDGTDLSPRENERRDESAHHGVFVWVAVTDSEIEVLLAAIR